MPSVSLVTGSARGLGLAAARELRARGDLVHVVWRSSRAAAPALEAEFPGRVHRADLEEAPPARALIEAVLARDGRLDHLVHAVGAYRSGPLGAAEADDAHLVWSSNVASALHVFGAARDALRASRGSAVFFGCAGLDGLRARRETALYAAAKSALLVLARSLALEEAPHGVRVNLVSPGVIPHPDAALDTLDPALHRRIPFGRPGTTAEVAAAVLFLCSENARYTTGADLPVAGGWML